MFLAAQVVAAIVALLHVYFMLLEMYFWDKPLGLRTFRQTPEQAAVTKVLAANQGLYNGFLAAGLLAGLLAGDVGVPALFFFLGCIVVAGVFGGATVGRKILFIQALPAALGLALLLLSGAG